MAVVGDKVWWVIRGLPKQADSRPDRYGLFLQGSINFKYWERGRHVKDNNFSLRIISYLSWLLSLVRLSLFEFNEKTFVVCIDLDTYLAIKFGALFKKTNVYLDIADPIAQTRFRRMGAVTRVFDWLEWLIIRFSGKVIIPHSCRLDYYRDTLGVDLAKLKTIPMVVENVPEFAAISTVTEIPDQQVKGNIRIGYFGGLYGGRGLSELLDLAIKNSNISLVVAGGGPLEAAVLESCALCNRIVFLGVFLPKNLIKLIGRVDFLWAYYSEDVMLHHYAAPNKFYEHLAYRIPIIISSCCPQAAEVSQYKTGLVINKRALLGSTHEFVANVSSFDARSADFSLWGKKYKDYYRDIVIHE